MTELQIGLISLGVIAVVGVVAYNKWQEMRQRRQASGLCKDGLPDVLLDGPPGSAEKKGAGERAKKAAVPQSPLDPLAAGERVEPMLRSEPAIDEAEPPPPPPLPP